MYSNGRIYKRHLEFIQSLYEIIISKMNTFGPPDRGDSDDNKHGQYDNDTDDGYSNDSSDKKIAALPSAEFAARQRQVQEEQEWQRVQFEQEREAQVEDDPIQDMFDSHQAGNHPIFYEAVGIPHHDEDMPVFNKAVETTDLDDPMGSWETVNLPCDQVTNPYSSVEIPENMGIDRTTLERIRHILHTDQQQDNNQSSENNPDIDSSRHVLQLDQHLNNQSGENNPDNYISESKNSCAFPSYDKPNFKRRGFGLSRDGTFDDRKNIHRLERCQEKKINEDNSRKKLNTREAMHISTDSITGDGKEIRHNATGLENMEGTAEEKEELQRAIEEDAVARARIGLEGMFITGSSDESTDETPSDITTNIEFTDSDE